MFEKTMQAMRNLDAIYNAAVETHKNAVKDIDANYKGKLADQKRGEAKALLQSTIQEEKKKSLDVFEQEFKEAREKVNNVITKVVPEDFAATLAAAQASGKTISDYEARAIIDKYKDNYMAVKAFIKLFRGLGKDIDRQIMQADAIEQEIEYNEYLIRNFLVGYNGSTLETAMLINDNAPLTEIGAKLDKFISGDFLL